MRHWLRDQHFRSLLKNSSYLGASKIVAAICGLAGLALAGRGLGVSLLGLLVLISSYVKAFSGLSKFQSWQLVIRYGGPALTRGDPAEFKRAVGFGLGLDIASGILGTAAAILLLPIIGGWFGIADEYLPLAMLYCAVLPITGAATSVGILRALDRFDLLSWQGTFTPILRALLTVIVWYQDGPFAAYLAVWLVTQLLGDLALWLLAFRELRRNELLDGIRPGIRPVELPGAWKFAFSTNMVSVMNTATGPIARLLVGLVLGPAGAGLYRVASTLADAARQPADLLGKAFYPEIARMDPAGRKPWKLMVRAMLLSALIGTLAAIVILLTGRWMLEALFGEEFVAAYPVLMVLMGAALIGLISFPMPSMLYALDRPTDPLLARFAGAAAFLLTIVPLSSMWDVVGAGVAFVINVVVLAAVMSVQLFVHRKRMARAVQPVET